MIKQPAIAIVTALALGIAMGFWPAFKAETSSHLLGWSYAVAALLLAAAGFFIRRSLPVAGFLSLIAWLVLGFCGAAIAKQPTPANHVLRLMELVISVGEGNPYGHPGPFLLERLQQADVPVRRTDQNGAIHISTDGKRFEVSGFVARPQITAMLDSHWAQPPDDQKHNEQQ